MASAQTEPSMDEILASIRRIISEEDDSPQELPVRQKLETLKLGDEAQAEAAPVPEAANEVEAPTGEVEAEAGVDADLDAGLDADASFEADVAETAEAAPEDEMLLNEPEESPAPVDELDEFEPLPEEPAAAGSTMEPVAEAQESGDDIDDAFADDPDIAAPTAQEADAPMPQAAVQDIADSIRHDVTAAAVSQLSVSEDAADQAANAFGALEENMRLSTGSGRTIEDMIEAMLAPMLKTWLDENLPRIVEDKVEEEVRRISRRR